VGTDAADHDTVTLVALAAAADTPATLFGGASGVTESLDGDHWPSPIRFVARTRNMYAVPLSRLPTVSLRDVAAPLRDTSAHVVSAPAAVLYCTA